ncbi:hypothetical protein B0H10DRAFT_2446824 [Mycena sp. CBHHK59/15]|nr:hypothetical protein B0H10DRAFT_2446824 [Mycena sp. CBHHK59/15]
MQKGLGRAWALASDLAWEVRPAISTTTLEAALCPLADHLSCEPCKAALNARIKALVSEWAIVKEGAPAVSSDKGDRAESAIAQPRLSPFLEIFPHRVAFHIQPSFGLKGRKPRPYRACEFTEILRLAPIIIPGDGGKYGD